MPYPLRPRSGPLGPPGSLRLVTKPLTQVYEGSLPRRVPDRDKSPGTRTNIASPKCLRPLRNASAKSSRSAPAAPLWPFIYLPGTNAQRARMRTGRSSSLKPRPSTGRSTPPSGPGCSPRSSDTTSSTTQSTTTHPSSCLLRTSSTSARTTTRTCAGSGRTRRRSAGGR